MRFFFNELSLNPNFSKLQHIQVDEVIVWLQYLLEIMKQAWLFDNKRTPELWTQEGIWGLAIGAIPIASAINKLDHDQKNLLLRINDKSPYIHASNNLDDVNYKNKSYHGVKALGLSIAYYLDCPTISFPSAKEWEMCTLTLEDKSVIFNFSKRNTSFEQYIKFFRSKSHCQQYIIDTKTFQKYMNDFWHKLYFSKSFINEIDSIEIKYLHKIVDNCCKLNSCCYEDTFTFATLQNAIPDVRVESQSVKQNSEYLKKREFQFDRFKQKFKKCLFHTSLDKSFRLYFGVDYQNKICYVGYAGKHLPTKKY